MAPTPSAEPRRSGILLHPTSLPGPYGIGDLGPVAAQFLEWLEAAGQTVWQMLPTNPTDSMGCPYASPSATAGNPALLSIDGLVDDGWLRRDEKPYLGGVPHRVDWNAVANVRLPALRLAARRVAATVDLDEFASERPWLAQWAMFSTLSRHFGEAWTRWPEALREKDQDTLNKARDEYGTEFHEAVALQWLYDQHWNALRAEADRRGVLLWGDLPLFVGAESCDAWWHRDLFRLDAEGRPTVISGAPPDNFSPRGQRWGHALYDVPAHRAEGHQWWKTRIDILLAQFDAVRIDHFRGLAQFWEIPADAPDATSGRWVDGPGAPLLQALADHVGSLPFIAEDLGIITPDVEELRDSAGLPGMVILQFAFGGRQAMTGSHPYLPHEHRVNQVVYAGTHDNDTIRGWWQGLDDGARSHVQRYLAVKGDDIHWDLMRAAWRSVARTSIVQMQDPLGLGSEARTNVPGRAEDNWHWRMLREALNLPLARRLNEETRLSGRLPGATP
jgi:4-alpha-glucanotransferase